VPDFVARLDGEVRRRILRRTDRPVDVPGGIAGEAGLVGAALLALSGGPE
jgi:N-acetylglucosamine kinase